MAIKNYMINDKWLDIAKENIVEVVSTDGVIGSVKVNGQEYGGGGGSSDFSTAKMTVINNKIKTIQVNDCPVASVDDEMLFGGFSVDGNSQLVFDVIIYKGYAYIIEMVTNIPDNIPVDLETEVSLSGSAVYDDSEGYIAITGDCTITIS